MIAMNDPSVPPLLYIRPCRVAVYSLCCHLGGLMVCASADIIGPLPRSAARGNKRKGGGRKAIALSLAMQPYRGGTDHV